MSKCGRNKSTKFKYEWKLIYFVTLFNELSVCVIYSREMRLMKEYNLKRHFNRKHAAQYNYEILPH